MHEVQGIPLDHKHRLETAPYCFQTSKHVKWHWGLQSNDSHLLLRKSLLFLKKKVFFIPWRTNGTAWNHFFLVSISKFASTLKENLRTNFSVFTFILLGCIQQAAVHIYVFNRQKKSFVLCWNLCTRLFTFPLCTVFLTQPPTRLVLSFLNFFFLPFDMKPKS